jgi:alcohol dehydrogenase
VNDCTDVARKNKIDCLIGLGGGSSLDTAKGCNFILTNGGEMKDYWGTGKATKPMLPMIAIPTTAGTGSECQSYALISDAKTHVKMACGDPKAAPRVALLDPLLTLSQPAPVTAHTGVDALVHALETAVTTKHNALSSLFSLAAFERGYRALPLILQNGDDIDARADMLLAAAYAGLAIENSMLGAAHATANPLTAQYDMVHGQAVGVMMPYVIRYNAEQKETLAVYRQLAVRCGLTRSEDNEEQALAALLQYWFDLLQAAGLKTTLAELNIPRSDIPELAHQAARQWTGTFNPRPLTEPDLVLLYESAFP